jgi:ketosteroid isomerase-like protein
VYESNGSDEVRRTLHTYCRRLDERNLDALVDEVYLDDAVDDRQRGVPLRGRAAIKQYFAQALTSLSATAHILSNVDVDVIGDTARSTSRVTAYHWLNADELPAGRGADFVLLGSYDDTLHLTAAGWRIARRMVGALGLSGLASGRLPTVFAGFGGTAAK